MQNQRVQVTEEEFQAWLLHPVTEQFRAFLRESLEDLQNQWVNGNFTTETVDGTAQSNARSIGRGQVLLDILSLDFETLSQEKA